MRHEPLPLAPPFADARRAPLAALACAVLLALPGARAAAAPFEACPGGGFLTQGSTSRTYAIDPTTGDYTLGATVDAAEALNAVGFNPDDGYLYAWSDEEDRPVRVHADGLVEPLGDAVAKNAKFDAGDVSPELDAYFVYGKGRYKGLHSFSLDPDSPDYLRLKRVGDQKKTLKIYDLAFHPTTGDAWAVDKDGAVHRIDPTDGSSVEVGRTDVKGKFGAAWFDAAGNLHVGRNNDGELFRIDVDSGDYAAEPFASGPASSVNDGASCTAGGLAEGPGAPLADYGDAPDSYATSLASDGARHVRGAAPGPHLGARVDVESDAYASPLSDVGDVDGEPIDDDDGLELLTAAVAGETVQALVNASAPGLLSVWIDLGRDGRFDPIDRVAADLALVEGDNRILFALPAALSPGETWARLRLSTAAGLGPTGSAPDGEVEDVRVTLLPGRTTVTAYPSETGWATVAFEDNWPFVGDYDMNDLVVHLRTGTERTGGLVTRVTVDGELAAVGASYANGFAIALPGVLRSEVDEAGIEFSINGEPVADRSALEANRTQAILVVDENMRRYGAEGEDCAYFRTEPGCGADIPMTFSLSVPFVEPVDVSLSELLDPFLFATPGEWHGAHFAEPPGRSYEIHLKNRPPTEAFNPALFARVGQDASDPAAGRYYQTESGMPWALAIGERWEYPAEFEDVSEAYPSFVEFATSGGTEAPFWYDPDAADPERVFTE